jgi:hypothetical protein
LQDYRTRYELRIESRGHASPQRGAPRLSPINSKCSTCDRIKVYHLGRVFSNLGDSRGRRNGVDHRLRGLESHRALVNKLHFFRPSGRRLEPASPLALSVSRENPGQKAQRKGAKGLVAFGGASLTSSDDPGRFIVAVLRDRDCRQRLRSLVNPE